MSARIHNKVVYGPEEQCIPAHLSYGQLMFDQLKRGGNNVAQVCAETGRVAIYREILQRSVNLAVALQRLGLKKGDVVSLRSPSTRITETDHSRNASQLTKQKIPLGSYDPFTLHFS